jgi:diaminopimelate dehydrogenase
MFNTVDSYDKHTDIPKYMASIDAVAVKTTAVIASGWDPGLFSIMRTLFESTLPDGENYTFWGQGVSQGHSDAVRHVKGVSHAVQYTVPINSAIEVIRSGERPFLEARQKHRRECFVVAEPGADKDEITENITKMPYYFINNETTVNYIEYEELLEHHSKMPHGGFVLRSGNTGENNQLMEFSLKLDSNPEFTANVLIAYARAAFRMSKEGLFGAKTVFDIPLYYLSEKDRSTLIKDLL